MCLTNLEDTGPFAPCRTELMFAESTFTEAKKMKHCEDKNAS